MKCIKCGIDLRDGAKFCDQCGASQTPPSPHPKKRGNGQGTVLKLPSGKYKAVVTIGYLPDDDGAPYARRVTRSRTCRTKKEAVEALATLRAGGDARRQVTFMQLYDKWLPTHQASKSTMDGYSAAYKLFEPVWFMKVGDVTVDDLQACIDECGRGRRTQENMRTLVGLMYKYGMPRGLIPDRLNLAEFLRVGGEHAAERDSFTLDQINAIRGQIGHIPGAEYVYCLIYLGYRPSEFLTVDASMYDRANRLFRHGAKTAAGKDRCVTISPKIQPYIDELCRDKIAGAIFCDASGKQIKLRTFTDELFYPVLEAAGIDNPVENGRHRYTPHTCRHTFATLMKAVDAPSKDKLELIGHSSEDMLRYYQDVDVEDLRKITDAI